MLAISPKMVPFDVRTSPLSRHTFPARTRAYAGRPGSDLIGPCRRAEGVADAPPTPDLVAGPHGPPSWHAWLKLDGL